MPDRLRNAGKFILAAGSLLLVAWLAGVVAGPTPREGTIEFEYRKFLMQFLIVGAVGAVAKFVVDDSTRKRDERLSRLTNANQRAGEFLATLSATYSDVKDIRVSLDLVAQADLRKTEYMDAMWRARRAQQTLERLKDRAVELEAVVSSRPRTQSDERRSAILLGPLNTMEEYLGQLTDEWRREAANWTGEHPPEPLPRLDAFYASTSETGDFALFDTPYHDAREAVLKFLADQTTE